MPSTTSPVPAGTTIRLKYPGAAVERVAALIPAWQPELSLLSLVSALSDAGFSAIIVVDDGSSAQYQTLFEAVGERPEVHLIRHAVNMGKGRALKTGMNYFLNTFPDFRGVVTADADRPAHSRGYSHRRCGL